MKDTHVLAAQYARALTQVVGNQFNRFLHDALEKVMASVSGARGNWSLLRLRTISDARKEQLLLSVIGDNDVQKFLTPLIVLLIKHDRASLFPFVLAALITEYKRLHGIVEFTFESACPLDEPSSKILASFLHHKTRKEIWYTVELKPALIAGIRLKSDCYLWEFSLRNRLERLKHWGME